MTASVSTELRDARDIRALITGFKQCGWCTEITPEKTGSGLCTAIWRHQPSAREDERVEFYLCFRNASNEMCVTLIDSTYGDCRHLSAKVRLVGEHAVVDAYMLYSAVFGNDEERSWQVPIGDMWTAKAGLTPMRVTRVATEDETTNSLARLVLNS